MYRQIIMRAIFAIGTAGQMSYLTDDARAIACSENESPRTSADAAESQVTLAENHANIMRRLERMSELNLGGHPSPMIGRLWLIEHEESDEVAGWSIPVTVDRQALMRYGIRLDELLSSGRSTGGLRAGGVRRRSSLRFVLG